MNLLTVPEAAQRLRVSRQTIYSLCKAGKLPHIKVGGSVRILEEKLDEMIAAGATPQVAPPPPIATRTPAYQMQALKV